MSGKLNLVETEVRELSIRDDKKMYAIDQTTSATEVDIDVFAFNFALGQVFQDMPKGSGWTTIPIRSSPPTWQTK